MLPRRSMCFGINLCDDDPLAKQKTYIIKYETVIIKLFMDPHTHSSGIVNRKLIKLFFSLSYLYDAASMKQQELV